MTQSMTPFNAAAVSAVQKQRLFFHHYPAVPQDTVAELLKDLGAKPRRISPKYFYDTRGASLFDTITTLPEYYPTRVERAIYQKNAMEIARAVGREKVLIEPGSGSCEKVELLLDSLLPSAYVPLEITESHLRAASNNLVESYPWLTVHAICADYSHDIALPEMLPEESRLVFFPGSTIGNFEPEDAAGFLQRLHRLCGPEGMLLIGVDLIKDCEVLHDAYNDSASVTAAFNLNVLTHVNRLGRGDFNIEDFRHVAFFNRNLSRIEMHLESVRDQDVRVGGECFHLPRGERIHTENSYKYTVAGFQSLALAAGFEPLQVWRDPADWFSVQLFRAV